MTTCLVKSCLSGLPCVSFVNFCHLMCIDLFLLVRREVDGICLDKFLTIACFKVLLRLAVHQALPRY